MCELPLTKVCSIDTGPVECGKIISLYTRDTLQLQLGFRLRFSLSVCLSWEEPRTTYTHKDAESHELPFAWTQLSRDRLCLHSCLAGLQGPALGHTCSPAPSPTCWEPGGLTVWEQGCLYQTMLDTRQLQDLGPVFQPHLENYSANT